MVPAILAITARNNSGFAEVYEFIDDETGDPVGGDFLALYNRFVLMVRRRATDAEAYVIATSDNGGITIEGDHSLAVRVTNTRLRRMSARGYTYDLLGYRVDGDDPDPIMAGDFIVEQGVTR